MKITQFTDYTVWQKAHRLTLEVYKTTLRFPAEERYGLSTQLRRSASSICSNIAEGYTKSRKDFIRFLSIARGSLEETKYHLILSKDLNYLDEKTFEMIFTMSDEIGKMLYSLVKRLSDP